MQARHVSPPDVLGSDLRTIVEERVLAQVERRLRTVIIQLPTFGQLRNETSAYGVWLE